MGITNFLHSCVFRHECLRLVFLFLELGDEYESYKSHQQ